MRRKLTGMVAPSTLRRLALAGMVALLVGGAPLAQTPEPAQDDSIETVRTRANAGNAEAQRTLGAMYEFGLGVPQNGVEAVAWYRQAAEQGHAGAQYNLGRIYGIAAPRTPITAQQKPTPEDVADIRVRAEQGEAEAQYQLGKMYEVGRGIAGNLAEAVAWYRRAADQGDMRAQYELGSRYGRGDRNIPADFAQARVWMRRAADQGHPKAQLSLALDYRRGDGVPTDLAQSETLRQAVEEFRRAAEQGDAKVQYDLGLMYLRAEGVPTDHAQAVAWYRRAAVSFRRAAEQGDAEAQYDLGRLIEDTETFASIGLPNLWSGANPEDSGSGWTSSHLLLNRWAFAWYLSAAKQGYAEAQKDVAYRYYSGEGVREDRAEAEAWYRRAAEQEHVFSQNSLAGLYERGDGIPQDDAEAVVWYRRAAEQGSVAAAEDLAEMYAEGRGVPLKELEQLRQDVAEVFQQLAEFPNVQAIRIEDDWQGFGSISSREAHYALERRSDGFEGPGVLSVASWSNGQQEALVDVVVPLDVVQEFLRMLAGSPLDQSIYLPSRGMTDNYPSTKIELDLETDTVVFFTTSQGAGGIPWGLTLKGVTFVPAAYVINSDIPMGALETLGPYLEREMLASLINQVQGR